MDNKIAYFLIIFGLILLALNTGFVNLSRMIQPSMLPYILIAYGVLELLLHWFDFGEAKGVIKAVVGIIFFIIIIFNFGNIITRLFIPTITLPFNTYNLNNENSSYLNISNNSISAGFTDFTITSTANSFIVEYVNDEDVVLTSSLEFLKDEDYSIYFNFGNADINLDNLIGENNNLYFDNSFAEAEFNAVNAFDEISVDNSFGNLVVHTGSVTGEHTIIIDSAFGSVNVYVDENAGHWVETDSALGTVNNNIGIKNSDYEILTDKVHLIISSTFGTVNIFNE
ncbi:MAG: hypothetical protein JW791_01345 [Nanoarchaeota archaeon]|nr:hypothetical protein [Nanoarchaeota archaeon]